MMKMLKFISLFSFKSLNPINLRTKIYFLMISMKLIIHPTKAMIEIFLFFLFFYLDNRLELMKGQQDYRLQLGFSIPW